MRTTRFTVLFVLLTLFSFAIFAQVSPTESETEKEKARLELEKKAVAVLEQIVGETSLLKFPDNRALVMASAGDLMWKRDEKRARQLFRQAAEEIIQANNLPADTAANPFMSFIANASPRREILMTIAKHDTELALELLYATRPANVAAAMAERTESELPAANRKPAQNAAAMIIGSQDKLLVSRELQLEQGFSAQAADKDPKRAAKLLRESLAKNGVTNSIFQTVDKINQKDSELANELVKEIGQKLLNSDFAKKETERSVFTIFLQKFYLDSNKSPEKSADKTKLSKDTAKPIRIEDKLARDLANKMVDYLLQIDAGKSSGFGFENYFQFRQTTPLLEKIIPERAALVKQKQNAMKKTMPESFSMFDDDAFDPAASKTPEKMIANAANTLPQIREMMYKNAIDEAVKSGSVEKVRGALNQTPAGKERDDALAYLDSKIAETKIKDGKIEEARKLIDQLSSNKEKIERIVQLAINFQAKNTKEDKEFAIKLMDEARRLTDDTPQDEDAINDYLRVASGYAYVDPNVSFSMLDAFAGQVSDIVTAAALLAKYDKRNTAFKNGEMVLTRGLPRVGNSIFQYGKELSLLANVDIDRLRSITDRFQREDARLLLKLYIVQAFFNQKIGLEGGRTGGAGFGDGENMIVSFGN